MNPLAFLAGLWSTHHPVPRKRKLAALGIAGLTDLVQIVFLPLFWEGGASPFDTVLDILAAIALFAILGFKWRLLIGLVAELIPGLDLFPTWTAAVWFVTRKEGTSDEPEILPAEPARR